MPDRKLVYKESELAQGSPEWFAKRKRSLGGSEIACLMGASQWKNPQHLWMVKTGQIKEDDGRNAEAKERGNRLEPVARAWYEKQFGMKAEPLCLEHPDNDFMVSSLDGISDDRSIIFEAKCPTTAENHRKYLPNGKIADFRYPQLQHQLMVTAAVFHADNKAKDIKTHYLSFWWNEKSEPLPVVVEVLPDWDYIAELYRRECLFMHYVRNFEQPPASAFPTYYSSEPEPVVTEPGVFNLAAMSRTLPTGGRIIYGDPANSFKRASKRPAAAAA